MAVTLVLLPGLGSTAASFLATDLYALRGVAGVQVQAINYAADACSSIAAMAANAWTQIATPLAVLLGYSMGGFVAQAMVCQQPRRVAGVVLVSTTAPTLTQVYAKDNQRELRRVLHLLMSGDGTSLDPRVLHSDAYLRTLKPARKRARARVSLPMDQFMQQLTAVVALMTSGLAPTRLQCFAAVPVLVINGAQDVLIPPQVVDALDALRLYTPDYERKQFADAGHALFVEEPQRCNSIIAAWLLRIIG